MDMRNWSPEQWEQFLASMRMSSEGGESLNSDLAQALRGRMTSAQTAGQQQFLGGRRAATQGMQATSGQLAGMTPPGQLADIEVAEQGMGQMARARAAMDQDTGRLADLEVAEQGMGGLNALAGAMPPRGRGMPLPPKPGMDQMQLAPPSQGAGESGLAAALRRRTGGR